MIVFGSPARSSGLAVVVRSSGGAGATGWTAAVETDGAVVGLKLPPAVLGATWSAAGASSA